MKVFMYSKSGNRKFATFENIERVEEKESKIILYSKANGEISFDTKNFKSTIYQN